MAEQIAYDAICSWDGHTFHLVVPQYGIDKEGVDLSALHVELTRALHELQRAFHDTGIAGPSLPLETSGEPKISVGAVNAAPNSAPILGLRNMVPPPAYRRPVLAAVGLVSIALMSFAFITVSGFVTELRGVLRLVNNFVTKVEQIANVRNGMDSARIARDLGTAIDRTAKTIESITPERAEQIRVEVRGVVQKLQPIAAELRPLFVDPGHAPHESLVRGSQTEK